MKRSLDSLTNVLKSRPNTSDNSTSTGTHMKKLRKDVIRAKHLRRGASHASSAQEYTKSEWTCDELDLTKQIPSLLDISEDKFKLIEELFSIFTILELKSFTPDVLKEYSVNQLKEMCFEELNTLSNEKLKWMCAGNAPEDYVEQTANVSNDDKTDAIIQLSVDGNEYSDFLGAEGLQQRRAGVEYRDAAIQANESSLESSSDDDVDSNGSGEGWMNLFAKTQMEILELEMRARAIRKLLKEDEELGGKAATEESTLIESKDMDQNRSESAEECNVSNLQDIKTTDNTGVTVQRVDKDSDEDIVEDSEEDNTEIVNKDKTEEDLNKELNPELSPKLDIVSKEVILDENKDLIEGNGEEVVKEVSQEGEEGEICDTSESVDEINEEIEGTVEKSDLNKSNESLNELRDDLESNKSVINSEIFDENIIHLRIDSTIDFDEELEEDD